MSGKETYIFINGLLFIPSLGVIQSDTASQKLNLSEQYILLYLIQHADQPVTKNELIQAGWPDRVVSEASLFQIIRSLRLKLQEKTTGEIIATLPRVGYQLTQVTTKIYNDATLPKRKTDKRQIIIYAVFIMFTLFVLGTAGNYWLTSYKYPKQAENFTRTTMLDNNTLTLISVTEEGLDDLYQKIHTLYIEHKKNNNTKHLDNFKIYAYKGDQIYSIAWCQMDSEQTCLPHTDIAYQIKPVDWTLFNSHLLNTTQLNQEIPIIETQYARDPVSQIHIHFVDKSGIDSQVIYRYHSSDSSDSSDYSSLNFISEKNTDFYHTLSISSVSVKDIENESPFMATRELTPGIYNWTYENNRMIKKDQSTVLMIERLIEKQFNNKIVSYGYLLYQQPSLDLMLNHTYGIYWVHNSIK
ncbi:winged helix-turn-helix domain-containing protein [Photobacterium nomapromontoriensis]|uniref:winged helix-turn-helix domain-containing protein n=1 Tax=Photobacterium nomapromontoriensis TaxID=2910237 RepID=UPI003D0C48A2